ncbi:MAG: site-2 protease family protein [Pirellulaceae bacterium]
MRDPKAWSIRLGCWRGVTVRLHVLFVVFAAATFCSASAWVAAESMLGISAAAVLLLFLGVLAHELGHWWIARRAGMDWGSIVLGPLGGLPVSRPLADPRTELTIAAAGPLVNLCLALLCAVLLFAQRPGGDEFGLLLNPFSSVASEPDATLLVGCLKVALWINWLLFLLNLLPADPFDGGRVVRALVQVARPAWSDHRVAEVVFWFAVATAIGLTVVAFLLFEHLGDSLAWTWLALLLLEAVLLVSAGRDLLVSMRSGLADGAGSMEERAVAEAEATGDWREEPPLPEPPLPEPPFLALPPTGTDWDPAPDEAEERLRQEEIEATEAQLVDDILSRLHAHGMDSLSAEERALLQRVSARYRSRLGRRS